MAADSASNLDHYVRKWVWHCTDKSITTGQISVFSVLETLCALGLYVWLAFHFEHQWWLLISAIAAPIILLRSPESKAFGVKLLRSYLRDSDRKWQDFSLAKKLLYVSMLLLLIASLTSWLASVWLLGHTGWRLFWYSALLGLVVVPVAVISAVAVIRVVVVINAVTILDTDLIAAEVPSASTIVVVDTGVVTIAGVVAVVGGGVGGGMVADTMVVAGVVTGAAGGTLVITIAILITDAVLSMGKMAFKRADADEVVISKYKESYCHDINRLPIVDADEAAINRYKVLLVITTIVALIGFVPFIAMGIWLRSLLIRMLATMRYPLIGLRYLPRNWRETVVAVDCTHLPELLPGAGEVSTDLTVRGLWERVVSITDEDSWFRGIMAMVWYPPALIWRWSLKATLWLWFPLVLLLRPEKAIDNVGKVRQEAVTQIWISSLLLTVAIVVTLWLSTSHFTTDTIQAWAELAGENTNKWLEKLLALAAPPSGLIEVALWLCCSLIGLIWLYSQYIQKQSPKTLAEEDAIYDMCPEPKQMFLTYSCWLARFYTFLVVSFILLGYAVVLHLAHHYYPDELTRFLPAWLIAWL